MLTAEEEAHLERKQVHGLRLSQLFIQINARESPHGMLCANGNTEYVIAQQHLRTLHSLQFSI